MVFSKGRFLNKVLLFAVLVCELQSVAADSNFITITGNSGPVTATNYASSSVDSSEDLQVDDLTVGGSATLKGDVTVSGVVKQEIGEVFSVSGVKKLTTSLTEVAANILTVNFSTVTGSSMVHIVVFGDIPGGDIKYDAWIYLGTGNSMVQSARRNVSAGVIPVINTTFSEGSGIASIMISTGIGQSITNPVVFYEVCGAKINNVV